MKSWNATVVPIGQSACILELGDECNAAVVRQGIVSVGARRRREGRIVWRCLLVVGCCKTQRYKKKRYRHWEQWQAPLILGRYVMENLSTTIRENCPLKGITESRRTWNSNLFRVAARHSDSRMPSNKVNSHSSREMSFSKYCTMY